MQHAGDALADGRSAGRLHATRRAGVSTNPAKVPAAFDPRRRRPRPRRGRAAEQDPALLAGLVAHDPLELADHPGVRVGAHHRPDAVVGVSTVATQSRRASFTASFRVRLPD